MMITIQQCIFFLFASLLIAASLMTVLARNPVRAALFLVLAFFSAAALWIMLEAEFLGLILVLVYVGAVMTLFLFVVMMLNIDVAESSSGLVTYLPYALITVAVLLAILIYALFPVATPQHALVTQATHASNTQVLGDVLYTHYAYPFEIVGVLLLVAIIASIALSGKEKRFNKSIAPEKQFKVKSSDRLRIIKMGPSKKT